MELGSRIVDSAEQEGSLLFEVSMALLVFKASRVSKVPPILLATDSISLSGAYSSVASTNCSLGC